jgi:transcriptional regulator of acetoin/glycerol metabolism
MKNALELCEPCLTKLRAAAARGGRSGSRESKVKAAIASVAERRKTAARLTFNGKTLSIIDWAKRIGVAKKTIYRRLKRNMPIEKVLSKHGAEHLPLL